MEGELQKLSVKEFNDAVKVFKSRFTEFGDIILEKIYIRGTVEFYLEYTCYIYCLVVLKLDVQRSRNRAVKDRKRYDASDFKIMNRVVVKGEIV